MRGGDVLAEAGGRKGGEGERERETHAMRMMRSRLSALFIRKAPGSYSSKVDPVEKKRLAASSVALVM